MNFKRKFYLLLLTVICIIGSMPVSELSAQKDSILLDFGDNLSGAPWNDITDPDSSIVFNLINSNNDSTDVNLEIVDDFNNINRAGTETPSPNIPFPATVSGDSFFGNVSSFGGQEQPTAGVQLSQLDEDKEYEVSIFASRVATDNRETQYIVAGATIDTLYLNISSNDSIVVSTSVFPDSAGHITVSVSPGPNNDNGSGFYYLGGMILSYEQDVEMVVLDTLLIDFGSEDSPLPWNNISDPDAGEISDLLAVSGFSSGKSIIIYDDFNNINEAGTQEPSPSIGIPATASGDSFFGNIAPFGGQEQPTAGLRLANFDPFLGVEISLFASRTASDNRETQYIVSGATTDTLYLNVSSNQDQLVTTTVLPKEDGTIDIDVSPGPNNNNSSNFYYLGAMKVIYERGEIAPATLTLKAPNGGEFWQIGKTAVIEWESVNNQEVILEYSLDAGLNWIEIDTYPAIEEAYNWLIPNTPTQEAIVRISSGDLTSSSNELFTIADNDEQCNIVVLGSSTAEGTGASPVDSSWVKRYSKFLSQNNTKFTVTNLARGGYTTYHILPDGSEVPSGVNVTIDQDRNITKALSLNPAAIIVNMPSNDAANGYPLGMQLANFRLLAEIGETAGVPVYICTTQPRNFTDSLKLEIQAQAADSILSIFGDRAIDFWSILVASDTMILDQYDSGDGIHVNNSGHQQLFQQVLTIGLDTISCQTSGLLDLTLNEIEAALAFPNPFSDELNVRLTSQLDGQLNINIYDQLGRRIVSESHNVQQGEQVVKVRSSSSLGNNFQLYYMELEIISGMNVKRSVLPILRNK